MLDWKTHVEEQTAVHKGAAEKVLKLTADVKAADTKVQEMAAARKGDEEKLQKLTAQVKADAKARATRQKLDQAKVRNQRANGSEYGCGSRLSLVKWKLADIVQIG